ncbi:MAG: hypothetical protein R2865_09145 [Deinococcales bacterium]
MWRASLSFIYLLVDGLGIAQQELQVDFQLLDSQGRVIRELIDGQIVG